MHGEIYSVAESPVNSGDTSQIRWLEGSIYINSEKGVAIQISQVGVNEMLGVKEFWFDIMQLMDAKDIDNLYGLNSLIELDDNIGFYDFIYGWAEIDGENPYFAMYDSYGFSLYEDNDAIDIFAGESTDWAHLRGQYMRIK
jgi:hypothetical protein